MAAMRVVVGTLYCGENEYDECCAAIDRQTLKPVDHFVLRHLPKHEAHTTLYREFARRAELADVFVKLDADMVIARDDLFERIGERFRQDSELDHLKIALTDFFSDRLIGALNCYRSTCRWDDIPDCLHTDAPPANRRKRDADWSVLAPAAFHCKNPSPFQAFHFGFHKGLKVLDAARTGRVEPVNDHWVNIELTWKHYLRTGDERLLLASMGAEVALSKQLSAAEIDYESVVARQLCARYQALIGSKLERRVRCRRLWNRRGLPGTWRARQLALGWRSLLSDPPSRGHVVRHLRTMVHQGPPE